MDAHAQRRLQEIEQRGFDLEIGDLTKTGWQIWKKVTLSILCAMLLVGIPVSVIYIVAFPFATGMSLDELSRAFSDTYTMQQMQLAQLTWQYRLIMLGVTFFVTILTAPISAGLLKMCYDADSAERINFGVIFKYYSGKYFGKLIVVSLLAFFLTQVPSTLLQAVPVVGPILGAVISLLIHTFIALAVPLIIFNDASPSEAIKGSFSIISKNFFLVLGFNIVGALLGISGFLACCIGFLLSFSYFYITNYLLYKQIIGFESKENENEFNATPASMY